MKITIFAAALLSCSAVAAAPLLAQDPTTTTGSMSSSDVGVAPLSEQSASDYVNAASDSDLYEIQSSRVALTKSKNANVKSFARHMQQQMQAHQTAWAIHKGFVLDGNDPALKQVASTALPIVERHFSSLKAGGMAGM